MGKGSTPRPFSITQVQYGQRFERTFPKKASRSMQEKERELANNYAEHARRLQRSAKLHAPVIGEPLSLKQTLVDG